MFTFDNVLTAGTVLVRQQIESQDYTPSGGTTGWAILADGNAFFNNATIRGVFIVGDYPNGEYLIIGDNPNDPSIEFQTTGPGGALGKSKIEATGVFFNFNSGDFGFGANNFNIAAPNSAAAGGGFAFVGDPSLPATLTQLTSNNAVAVKFGNTNPSNVNQIGLASLNHLFQLGRDGAPNLIAGNFGLGYGIQGRDNGGTLADFYINPVGTGRLQLNSGGGTVFTGGAIDVATTGSFGGAIDAPSATIPTISNSVVGGITLSGGVLSNTGGTTLGASMVLGGGQLNAVNPPTGAGPGAGTAWWNNTAGSNYRLSRTTSSRRYKENIRDLDAYDVDQLLALAPRWYQRNDHRDYTSDDEPMLPVTDATPWVPGFIAEEAHELGLRSWVAYDEEERPDSFSYGEFAAVAHQYVLRAQRDKIQQLEQRLEALERMVHNDGR